MVETCVHSCGECDPAALPALRGGDQARMILDERHQSRQQDRLMVSRIIFPRHASAGGIWRGETSRTTWALNPG